MFSRKERRTISSDTSLKHWRFCPGRSSPMLRTQKAIRNYVWTILFLWAPIKPSQGYYKNGKLWAKNRFALGRNNFLTLSKQQPLISKRSSHVLYGTTLGWSLLTMLICTGHWVLGHQTAASGFRALLLRPLKHNLQPLHTMLERPRSNSNVIDAAKSRELFCNDNASTE